MTEQELIESFNEAAGALLDHAEKYKSSAQLVANTIQEAYLMAERQTWTTI